MLVGAQLYTGSQDSTVRVWSCETGDVRLSPLLHLYTRKHAYSCAEVLIGPQPTRSSALPARRVCSLGSALKLRQRVSYPSSEHKGVLLCCAQCTAKVEVGGEVDSMLLESSFLFVGLHQVAAVFFHRVRAGTPYCAARQPAFACCAGRRRPRVLPVTSLAGADALRELSAGQSWAGEGLEHHHRG